MNLIEKQSYINGHKVHSHSQVLHRICIQDQHIPDQCIPDHCIPDHSLHSPGHILVHILHSSRDQHQPWARLQPHAYHRHNDHIQVHILHSSRDQHQPWAQLQPPH